MKPRRIAYAARSFRLTASLGTKASGGLQFVSKGGGSPAGKRLVQALLIAFALVLIVAAAWHIVTG